MRMHRLAEGQTFKLTGIIIMKTKFKPKPSKAKSRIWGTMLIATLLLGGTAQQAQAIDLVKTFGDLRKSADSLLYQFKNNPTVSSILGTLNQITSTFSTEIQRFTNISNADLNKVKGVLGVLAPNETKKAIEQQQPAANTIPGVTAENQAALGTTTSTADSALSKEAQEADKKSLEESSDMVKSSENIASDSADNADAAQQADSSQDVLKILASQHSNQAAINAAQLRLAALQNANLQAIKTQLAVANQANASFESRLQGEAQAKALKEREKAMNIAVTTRDKYSNF
jgi:hypothetical protein